EVEAIAIKLIDTGGQYRAGASWPVFEVWLVLQIVHPNRQVIRSGKERRRCLWIFVPDHFAGRLGPVHGLLLECTGAAALAPLGPFGFDRAGQAWPVGGLNRHREIQQQQDKQKAELLSRGETSRGRLVGDGAIGGRRAFFLIL